MFANRLDRASYRQRSNAVGGNCREIAPDAFTRRRRCRRRADRPPRIHAAPPTLDEHVVPPSAPAVHADLDVAGREHASEGRAHELAALVGIEDRWLSVPGQSILQRRGLPLIMFPSVTENSARLAATNLSHKSCQR